METKDAVAIKITCFDNHAGELKLIYNNGDGQVEKTQVLNGDSELKTVTFFVSGMHTDRIGQNFDFALEAGEDTQNIAVSFVRVIK